MRLLYTNARRIVRAACCFCLTAASLLSSACNSPETVVDTSKYSTQLSLSSDSVQVPIGSAANVVVTVARGGGYADVVTLAIDTVPVGLTATYSSQVIGVGATATILTLAAGPTAVAGTTAIKLRGSGFAVVDDTVTIYLTVVPPAIAVTAGATAASASINGSATIPLTFDRLNGYTGPIFPTAEGVPANVTATFTPALVPFGSGSSTLILSPLPGAVAGTSTITIRAAGSSGVVEKTTPFAFTITSPTTADFAPSASPAAVTLVTGTTATSVVSLNRVGGLTSNVAFTLSGLPTGVTAAFSQNPTASTSTTITFTASSAVTIGKYNLTLTGTAVGGATHVIPLVLTVAKPLGLTIALIAPTVTIAKASIGQSALLVTRVGGLVGDITLTTDTLPTGVTSAFAPSTLTGAATASVVGFVVGSTAVSGTYSIVVRGTTTATTTVPSATGSTTLTLIVPQ